jgi:hypothetical protein
MTFKIFLCSTILYAFLINTGCAMAQPKYEPAWESLSKHKNPAWFRDAKFDIYTQTITMAVPKTRGWFKPVFVNLGQFKVDSPGVYKLTLEPADVEKWKAVNVWQLQTAPIR